MANVLLTPQEITSEFLRLLENKLVMVKGMSRHYDSKFKNGGAKIGNTLDIRKPPRYIGRTGKLLQVEDTVDTSIQLKLDTQFGVDVQFDSQDLALSIDSFSKKVLKPAVATISNYVEAKALALALKVANQVGNPATPADKIRMYLDAGALLDSEGVPVDGERSAIVGPFTQAALVEGLTTQFANGSKTDDEYETGNMGVAAGLKFSMGQNVVTHVFGSGVGSAMVVDGAEQAGTSLKITGLAGVLKEGDTFTIEGVYAVNPQSRQSTGKLRNFVVTETTAANATTIKFSPELIADGQFQNVSDMPASGAQVKAKGIAGKSVEIGVVYHKDAFTLACADLPLPTGGAVEAARVSDDDLGLSIRMVRQFDIKTDTWPCRFDILFGMAIVYPEYACRVISNNEEAA